MRLFYISLAFFCIFSVVFIGNHINYNDFKNKLDRMTETERVYHQYEIWEEDQIKKNPVYDNLAILIDIDSKTLYVIDMDEDKIIKKYTVAAGKKDTPSPTGSYRIIQKAKWGAGFGTRWMKLNVPWGNYGIHGTNKPNSIGYNASHGCIRMRNKDVEELYKLVKYNTPVTLIRGNFGPFGHGFRILAPGDRGEDVKEVQKRLKIKGYYKGSLDGVYGEGMKAALVKFLKDNNLPLTDKIGYNVYHKLDIFLME